MEPPQYNKSKKIAKDLSSFVMAASLLMLAVLAAAYGVGYLHGLITCTFF